MTLAMWFVCIIGLVFIAGIGWSIYADWTDHTWKDIDEDEPFNL